MGIFGKSNSKKYYCKYCGSSQSEIGLLVGRPCNKNPHGKKHELYEGEEKKKYFCKYCGSSASSIVDLTSRPCHMNPNRIPHHPAFHEPAL